MKKFNSLIICNENIIFRIYRYTVHRVDGGMRKSEVRKC